MYKVSLFVRLEAKPGKETEVAMIRDAIGGTTNEEGDGVQAALVNFRFMAHALWTTEETVRRMREASASPVPTPSVGHPVPIT